MTKEEILLLQAKPRLVEYLRTTGAPFWPPALTICPHCGEQVGINILHEWHCAVCDKKGDIVDYVLAVEHFDNKGDALRHICKVLKQIRSKFIFCLEYS